MNVSVTLVPQKCIDDINEILRRHGNPISNLNPTEWVGHSLENGKQVMFYKGKKDPFKDFFNTLNPVNLSHVFAYKKTKRIVEMLENNVINFTNLELNSNRNDDSEYTYMVEYLDYPHPFEIGEGGIKNVDAWRKRIFVYCLTNNDNEDHWNYFGDDEQGSRIEYSFSFKQTRNQYLKINYGDVFYEDDSLPKLAFIKEITQCLAVNYGIIFVPQGVNREAFMCKRKKICKADGTEVEYYKEKEKRIAFDFSNKSDFAKGLSKLFGFDKVDAKLMKEMELDDELPNGFTIKRNEDGREKGVLEIARENEIFSWEIHQVVAGKNADVSVLKPLCQKLRIPFVQRT